MTIHPAPIIAIHSPLVSVVCCSAGVSVWLDGRSPRKWTRKVRFYRPYWNLPED